MLSRQDLEDAAAKVYRHMQASPQLSWPLLNARVGAQVWVKHENHNPTGAFKVRGGVTFIDWLRRQQPDCPGIVTATRGNHGQSQARAACAQGLRALVYVPRGNSREKNAAMRAFGAELIEHGDDFDAAREEAMRVAQAEGLAVVPPFHPELVRGVATYALELFQAVPDLHTVYVPIGCGSGLCGTLAARDALGLSTRVVGVVADGAPAAKRAFETGDLSPSPVANTFADGLAVRVPVAEAVATYRAGAERVVSVGDGAIAEAMRIYFSDTHNVAEGAGAAALAALLQEREAMAGKRVGVVLSGANIDAEHFAAVLSGSYPGQHARPPFPGPVVHSD